MESRDGVRIVGVIGNLLCRIQTNGVPTGHANLDRNSTTHTREIVIGAYEDLSLGSGDVTKPEGCWVSA